MQTPQQTRPMFHSSFGASDNFRRGAANAWHQGTLTFLLSYLPETAVLSFADTVDPNFPAIPGYTFIPQIDFRQINDYACPNTSATESNVCQLPGLPAVSLFLIGQVLAQYLAPYSKRQSLQATWPSSSRT